MQSLWIGERLTAMERACVESFLQNGHGFDLYVYNDVEGIPVGVTVRDANEIIPCTQLHFGAFRAIATFADFFRYKLLFDRGGWWVDTDLYCLRPFDFTDDYVFSSEDRPGGIAHVNNGVLKAPAGSDFMLWCWQECWRRDPANIPWGDCGPQLMAQAIAKFGMESRVRPPEAFCPIPYYHWWKLTLDSHREFGPQTYGVHLWREMWARNHCSTDEFRGVAACAFS